MQEIFLHFFKTYISYHTCAGADGLFSPNPTDGAYIKLDISGELPTDRSVVFAGLNTARLICKNGEIEVVLTDTVY